MPDTPSMPAEPSPEGHQPIVVSPAPAFEVAAPAEGAAPHQTKPRRRRRLWLWLLVLLLLGLGGYFLWSKITAKQSADAAAESPAPGPPSLPTTRSAGA